MSALCRIETGELLVIEAAVVMLVPGCRVNHATKPAARRFNSAILSPLWRSMFSSAMGVGTWQCGSWRIHGRR
jgi:hypothetical protein